ncbi:MAG: 3-dehydroquinate synthase family protein [Bacteroidota bacterium]
MYYPIKIKESDITNIYEGATVFSAVQNTLKDHFSHLNKKFILVDENTRKHCLDSLVNYTPALAGSTIIEIKSGEAQKNIETVVSIWQQLSDGNAGRDAMLVNLGGGVITDVGGFAAATYKRGIPYLNVPTTLVGMSDAAIGGKIAINLNNLKNQIGMFLLPRGTYIYSGFLRTLGRKDFLNGVAEIIKYGLIMDVGLFKKVSKLGVIQLLDQPFKDSLWDDLIRRTVKTKSEIIEKDFRDHKERRLLNFGHTIGHAFESYGMTENGEGLSRGHAVAMGIICESYLSGVKAGLKQDELNEIVALITSIFPVVPIESSAISGLMTIMKQDKKSSHGELQFTLIKAQGKAIINQPIDDKLVRESFEYYRTFIK